MKKSYYYDKSQEELKKIGADSPTLLLHTCCAVCATVPLEQLTPYFKATLFFNNSNIYPLDEYQRRLTELIRYLQKYPEVKLIQQPYDHDKYMADLREYAKEPEGGKRCLLCYRKRMKEAYEYAKQNQFDYFTTVMTISRQKNSLVLNKIGEELEPQFSPVKYFYSDFKKHDGQQRSIELRNQNYLYQQTYCGCEYSMRENDLPKTVSASQSCKP